MGVAGQPQRANHIRSISGLFLSRTLSVETRVPQSVCGPELECRVTGRPGSPWPLALAASLALSAWRLGESVRLELPPSRLALAARLLGAPPSRMGLDWRASAPPPLRVEVLPGLLLLGPGQAEREATAPGTWRLQLVEGPRPGHSPILALVESADGAAPSADGAPLFLLGLDLTPPPRRGVTGIWGPLARRQLLDPGRLGALALQSGDPPLRRRYQGFLEALRRTPTGGRPR
ncbi:MAG: hypothetical protein H6693_03760 [Candidatus Latescibacteria bacterium]|nr:hypothetical protein [Candidatus Latescibacterota bacterium]